MRACTIVPLVWIAAFSGEAANATTITGADNGTNNPAMHDPYIVSLDPVPATHIGRMGGAALNLLEHDPRNRFSNWTFINKGDQKDDGTFNILQYEPFALATLGGADFSVLYSDGKKHDADNPAPTNLSWIQIAYAHNWAHQPGNETTVDTTIVSGSPFYSDYSPGRLPGLATPRPANPRYVGPDIWKDRTNYPQQHIQNPAGGGQVPQGGNLMFVDEPKCTYDCVPRNDFSSLVLDLFLVDFAFDQKAGHGTINIYDGIEWGVEITCKESGKCPPTPETSTWFLMGGGLALLGIWKMR